MLGDWGEQHMNSPQLRWSAENSKQDNCQVRPMSFNIRYYAQIVFESLSNCRSLWPVARAVGEDTCKQTSLAASQGKSGHPQQSDTPLSKDLGNFPDCLSPTSCTASPHSLQKRWVLWANSKIHRHEPSQTSCQFACRAKPWSSETCLQVKYMGFDMALGK